MNPVSPHLTPLDFDNLSLDTLGSQQAALHAHVAACPACQQEQASRRALADQFAREVLPFSLPVNRRRMSSRCRRRFAG